MIYLSILNQTEEYEKCANIKSIINLNKNNRYMSEIKQGDRIRIFEDKVKIVFGFHKNGNPLIKNGDTLCQVALKDCRKW